MFIKSCFSQIRLFFLSQADQRFEIEYGLLIQIQSHGAKKPVAKKTALQRRNGSNERNH
jgi:hypothetical protein